MSEQEKKSEQKSATLSPPPVKTKLRGAYAYIGQDTHRFLFQHRNTKKCYTVEKTQLTYRGEHKFNDEVLATIQK